MTDTITRNPPSLPGPVGAGGGATHRGARRALAVCVTLVVLAELAVRAAAPHLPTPLVWTTREMQVKADRMGALASRGGAGVAFVGSSMTDAAADPAQMGRTGGRPAYNAALRGSTMAMERLWTAKVVLPLLRPEVVVLGVASRELNDNDPSARQVDRDFRDAPEPRRLAGQERVLDRLERWADRWVYLIRERRVLRQPLDLVGRPPDRVTFLDADGHDRSFTAARYTFTEAQHRFLAGETLTGFTIGADKVDDLVQLVRSARRSGATVVLVDMPVTEQYVALHPRGRTDYDAAVARMRSVAASEGAPFVDAGVWHTSLFADAIHLNGAGATRFTALIDDELRRLGLAHGER